MDGKPIRILAKNRRAKSMLHRARKLAGQGRTREALEIARRSHQTNVIATKDSMAG